MERFSHDIIYDIFSRIEIDKNVNKIMTVCKTWNNFYSTGHIEVKSLLRYNNDNIGFVIYKAVSHKKRHVIDCILQCYINKNNVLSTLYYIFARIFIRYMKPNVYFLSIVKKMIKKYNIHDTRLISKLCNLRYNSGFYDVIKLPLARCDLG